MSNMSRAASEPTNVCVIGAGAWGTTLARMVALAGHSTTLVARTHKHAESITRARENQSYLPGVTLPPVLAVTADLPGAVVEAAIVLIVVPSREVRSVATALGPLLNGDHILVSCAKGLEVETLRRLSDVIVDAASIRTDRVCALSGPNLSGEIAAGMPASAVVASASQEAASAVQATLSNGSFRVYTGTDVVGVEYGGALKNVVAIGAGVADGLGLGQNAKAAFITRGLAEITRLGVAAGAHPLTFSGLSGLGDLIATCQSPLSRNRSFGERLGRGMTVREATESEHHVIEGIATARAAVALSERFGVEAPIASVVTRVIDGELTVHAAIEALLSRARRPELDGAPSAIPGSG